jgi:hypothetical protein
MIADTSYNPYVAMMIGDILANEGAHLALLSKDEWSKRADEWFSLLQEGENFTSEDLVKAIGLPASLKQNKNNAVGAKMRYWAENYAERIGYKKTTRTTSHSRMIAVWRKK